IFRRQLEPEGAEQRELLTFRLAGLQREAARRQAIELAAAERAEVAGAEENGDLVEVILAVHAAEQANAGKADVLFRHRLWHQLAVVEVLGGGGEVVRLIVVNDRGGELRLIIGAEIEQLPLQSAGYVSGDDSSDVGVG